MSDCQLSSQSSANIRHLEDQSYQFISPKNQNNKDQPPSNSFINPDFRILTTQRDQIKSELLMKQSIRNQIPIENTLDQIIKKLLISRIVKKWRTYAKNVQLESVNINHLKLINDLAYDFTTYQYKQNAIVQIITKFQNQQLNTSYYTKLNSKLKQYSAHTLYLIQILPVINPTTSYIIVIDIIVLVITLILSLIIPTNLAFRDLQDFTQDSVYIIDKSLSYLLLVEILFKFNVGYYQNGQIIMNRIMIFKHYFESILAFDLLTIIINIVTTNIFSLIFLFRIFNLDNYFFKLIFIFRVRNTIVNIINFLRLCYIIIFISHSIGCIWYIITKNNPDSSLNQLEDQGFYNLYINSLYWAVTTMLSVGYGDLVAKNNIEKLFSILTMFTGCGLFAYIMNQIGQLISEINAQQNQLQRQSIQIENYINKKPITDALKEKIRLMSQYTMNQKYKIAQFGQLLLGKIPNELLDDYRNQVQLQFIHNNFVFQTGFTEKFQYLLSRKLKSLIFLAGEQVHQDCLYFVESGLIIQKYYNLEFTTAKQNDLLFDVQFFSGFFDQNCYQAKTLSILFSINQFEMRSLLLETYDQSFERFHHIKDSLNLYSNYSILNKFCTICHSKYHLLDNCNQIHLVLNKNNIISRFLKSSIQPRRYFGGRTSTKQFQTWKHLQKIQVAGIYYLEITEFKTEQNCNIILKEGLKDPTSITFNHQLHIPSIEQLLTKEKYSQKSFASILSLCQINSQKEIYHSLQFDKYQNFDSYFPHNNISSVLGHYQYNSNIYKTSEEIQFKNIMLDYVLEQNS